MEASAGIRAAKSFYSILPVAVCAMGGAVTLTLGVLGSIIELPLHTHLWENTPQAPGNTATLTLNMLN